MGTNSEDVMDKSKPATEEPLENGKIDIKCETKSRYGRTIKPKSPSTIMESPKTIKIPKTPTQEPAMEEVIKVENDTSMMDESMNNTLDTSIKLERCDIEELQANSPWKLGQLVWAKIGSYPFWPGIVTLEPNSMSFVSKKGVGYKKTYCILHVHYCADKGRHSWVPFSSVIPFNGVDDYEKQKETPPEALKKKFIPVKASLKPQWDEAAAEATELMSKSIEERIDLFTPKVQENGYIAVINLDDEDEEEMEIEKPKIKESSKKRKQTLMDDFTCKKPKSERNVEYGEGIEGKLERKNGTGSNLTLDSPPTPPSSYKDSSDEAPIIRKLKNKRPMGSNDGVFEIFCERNKEVAEQLDPEATETDIKAYLLDLWENMNAQERSKYRADYLQDEEMKLYSLGMEEDDMEEEEYNDSEAEQEKWNGDKAGRKRKSRVKEEISDQEETTSVESENLDKSVRRRKKARRESSDRDDVVSVDSEMSERAPRKRRPKFQNDENASKDDLLLADITKRSRPNKIFKGMKVERVCQICEKPGKIIRCKGPCYSYFHLSCVKPDDESSSETNEVGDAAESEACKEDLKPVKKKAKDNAKDEEDESFKCIDCLSGIAPPCFVCHERDSEDERRKCSVIACGKHYHENCLKSWPQCHWQGERLTCPYHICHTCASDDPQNSHPRTGYERLVRCIRCPSTYHASISCLPAGSNILTGSQIICPKHYKSTTPPVNTTWCFLCTKGGSLICCDTCPMSFHVECLGIDAPEGAYNCEDCETGRLPLYGEVVWVKLGTYRWWPSVICYPHEIPPNILTRPHKTGEFCVMFLGTRDYYWIHRGKAFLFHDGDASTKVIGSKKVEESYRRALQEAKIYHEQLTNERAIAKDNGSKQLKPPPYVKLKVNKPVGNVKIPEVDSMVACECSPNQPHPCSPDSECLNRLLLIECSPGACPAGSKCQNQLFVRRNYPAMEPFHTSGRGWGLRALERIKEGQFIIEYVGEVIDEAEYRLRIQQKKERKNENYYFLTIDNNRMIDAEPKGNLSRFMNHSCQPNCETQKWTVNGDTRVGLFALRNIEPNEELTFNYNLASDGETKKPCLCNAPNCSGFIGLKVTKQPANNVSQHKRGVEKIDKTRRQRRKQKIIECWNCNTKVENGEESHRCDQKTCGKSYHTHCIAIEDGPEQIFHCPWHFCAECYKRTAIRCSYCCNAFCQNHLYGNLREHPVTSNLICYKHPIEVEDYVDMDMDMGEALMDDDGYDDVVITEDYGTVEPAQNDVATSKKSSLSPTVSTQSQNDETTSPRGTIVEVQPTSDADEEEDVNEGEEGNNVRKGKKRRKPEKSSTQKKKKKDRSGRQSVMESDLTLDQIAAIIGVV